MKIKFAGKWYEVAMVQYNFGMPYYEIYDEPDTDPEHTDWIAHPEEVIDDDGENSSFNTVDYKKTNIVNTKMDFKYRRAKNKDLKSMKKGTTPI